MLLPGICWTWKVVSRSPTAADNGRTHVEISSLFNQGFASLASLSPVQWCHAAGTSDTEKSVDWSY